jgi:ligand-binding sensor domain-containing protein
MEDSAIVSRIVHESCERAPSLMQQGRWWEHLDDGFARTSEKFDLARTDRLQIGAAAAFDHAVRAIATDQAGFVWFGTYEGLARYRE